MICPLKGNMTVYQDEHRQCEKGECAWYDNNKEQCCIKTLSQLKKIVVSGGINTHTY